MDTLETLYFPDTVIATDGQSPLFLFFDKVHFLRPVETDESGDSADGPATGSPDTFMDGGFCQGHTPVPLGADRDRFLHLVHDIERRKDDYAAQLSALTIASMSAPGKGDEDTGFAIVSSLLGGLDTNEAKETAAQEAEIWQARLVLTIGEILDREEEEITDALSILDRSKTDLFDRLLGRDEEEDAPFTDLAKLKEKIDLPRPGMIKSRLKAWISLYRAGHLSNWWLWTTSRMEAADILLEMYEKKTGRTARSFWQIELPAATGIELQDHMNKITAFKKEAEPLTARITSKFNKMIHLDPAVTPEPEAVLPEGRAWGEQWDSLLERHFPAELYGRTPFCFHLLRGLPLPELATAETIGGETSTGVQHGILAVIG